MTTTYLIRYIQRVAEAARAWLLNGIHKLSLMLETPRDTIMRILFQPHQSAALRLAVEMGLAEAIVNRDGLPTTAADLSEITGADKLLIARVMRVLTAMGICQEDGEDIYSANAVTKTLVSPGFSGGVRFIYDPFVPTAASLVKFMHQSKFQSPQNADEGPMKYALHQSHWQYLKENPVLRESMDAYMAVRRRSKTTWFDIFPAEAYFGGAIHDDPNRALLVDIGGSTGHDVMAFKDRYPHLHGRFILQDLPEAFDKMTAPLAGVEIMPYDFFTPQPVKGARAYFFHAVCHDWSDAACRKFLSSTISAMDKEYSRLLIYEFVLPNVGAGIQQATLDIHMMATVAGMERTEDQWRRLLGSIGLDVVKIWTGAPGSESVIEAKVAD